MPFTGDTFTHLFDWEKDPQNQKKINDARLEAEFDGVDTGLSAVAARVTDVENAVPANDSISNAQLANMAQATIKGRANAAGTGDPTDLTATQVLTIIKTVDGSTSGLDADLWKGATYTVSTSTPSGGSSGDFWFEREA